MKTTRQRVLPALIALGCLLCGALIAKHNMFRQRPADPASAASVDVPQDQPMRIDFQFRTPTAEERRKAIASVTGQLNAFHRGDLQEAMLYQSSSFRQTMPLDAFRFMMTTHYGAFLDFTAVRFGRARVSTDGRYLQIVINLTGKDKSSVGAVYIMTRENGLYYVDGVIGGDRLQRIPLIGSRLS